MNKPTINTIKKDITNGDYKKEKINRKKKFHYSVCSCDSKKRKSLAWGEGQNERDHIK